MSARLRFALITLAAVATALLTTRLGVWQLSRADEKVALQTAVEQQALRPVLETLPHDAQPAPTWHHRRVRLQGRWSSAHTVYLDNRQMNGRPGFFVVTPLVLADGRAVLVQRGWLPRDVNERTRIDDPPAPAADIITLEGRIAPPPARLFEFEGADAGRIRQNIDIEAFARETGLRLVPLSVLQTGPADKLLRNWPAPAAGVGKHHGYAFQWFGLSTLVVILYVWFQFIQPRRAGRR